jgi:hypothetical protein
VVRETVVERRSVQMILEMVVKQGFDVALFESLIERISILSASQSCYLANTTYLFSEHMP